MKARIWSRAQVQQKSIQELCKYIIMYKIHFRCNFIYKWTLYYKFLINFRTKSSTKTEVVKCALASIEIISAFPLNHICSPLSLAIQALFSDRTVVAVCASAMPKQPARTRPYWYCWLDSMLGRYRLVGKKLRRSPYRPPDRCCYLWDPVSDCNIPVKRNYKKSVETPPKKQEIKKSKKLLRFDFDFSY